VSTIDKSTILDTADPDSSKLISKILEEDLHKTSKNTSSEIALSVYGNHNHRGSSTINNHYHRSKYNVNVTCHYCKHVSHIQKECQTKKRDLQSEEKSGNNSNNNSNFRGHGKNFQNFSNTAYLAQSEFAFITQDIALPASVLTSTAWIADSDTTSHLVRDRSAFVTYTELQDHLIQGVGRTTKDIGKGDVKLTTIVENRSYPILLRDAIHCPTTPFNLVSISHITNMNCRVNFYQKGITITSPNNQNKIIISGLKQNGLYMLDITSIISHHACTAQIPQNRTWHDWHKVMGHIYMGSVKMLKEKDMIKGMEVNPDIQSPQCILCIKAKSHVAPFPPQSKTEYKEISDITFTNV